VLWMVEFMTLKRDYSLLEEVSSATLDFMPS
jgi:hypothetical protein